MQKKAQVQIPTYSDENLYNVYADVYLSACYQSVQLKKRTKTQKTAV